MTERQETPLAEYQGHVDPREAAVIEDANFYEPYKDDLKKLFTALGKEDEWSDDPRTMLPYMERAWIGQEHGNSTSKEQYDDEQVAAAMPILEDIGLTTELLPQPGEHFDTEVIIGGTMLANWRRLAATHKAIENGVDIDRVVVFLGQRPREARDGKNEELLGTEGRFAGEDIRENPWVKQLIDKGAFESEDPWSLTETDFGRIALNKVMGGNLMPHRIDLPIAAINGEDTGVGARQEGVPARDATDYHFTVETTKNDGSVVETEVILMNAAAVDRGAGRPARHTTQSSTGEYVERYEPKQGERMLYMTGNPHSMRTAQDSKALLTKLGRDDIHLDVAGTTPAANSPIQTYLGEVARLINNDVVRNYQETEK